MAPASLSENMGVKVLASETDTYSAEVAPLAQLPVHATLVLAVEVLHSRKAVAVATAPVPALASASFSIASRLVGVVVVLWV